MKKIIAFDFDGTLALTDYPVILAPRTAVIEYAKRCKKAGHTIILYTCREGEPLKAAVEFCKANGLEFDYVNENTVEKVKEYGESRKIYADFYFDDHARPPEFIEDVMEKG